MVVAALEDAAIPCYRRLEMGSTQMGMPLAPADWIGQTWCVFVPDKEAAAAQEILIEFPFTQEEVPEPTEAPESAQTHRYIILGFIAVIVLIICWALSM